MNHNTQVGVTVVSVGPSQSRLLWAAMSVYIRTNVYIRHTTICSSCGVILERIIWTRLRNLNDCKYALRNEWLHDRPCAHPPWDN